MNSIKKNFFYNAVFQILNLAFPLITTPYIARILGANGIGMYTYAYTIASYFGLFIMLGLSNYGSRTIAFARGEKYILSNYFINIYFSQIILGIIVIPLYIYYSIYISQTELLSLILVLVVISNCFDITWFYYGMEEFKFISIRNIIIKGITVILIFLLIHNKNDLYKYCFLMSFSAVASQISLWPFLKGQIKFIKPNTLEIYQHLKPNLLLFSTVLFVSLFRMLDKVMLGLLSSFEELAFFELSERFTTIPLSLVVALGSIMLPRVSHLMANKKFQDNNIMHISFIFTIFITSSLSFGIMSVSNVFVPWFFGNGYSKCIECFLLLLPSCLFIAFANVIRTQYLLPKKYDKVYIQSGMLGAGINIICNFFLIPLWGALGASLATLLAEIFVCFYQCYFVKRFLAIYFYIKQVIPFVVAGIIMFYVNFTLVIAIPNLLYLLITKIILGIVVYFFILSSIIFLYRKHYKILINVIPIKLINKYYTKNYKR